MRSSYENRRRRESGGIPMRMGISPLADLEVGDHGSRQQQLVLLLRVGVSRVELGIREAKVGRLIAVDRQPSHTLTKFGRVLSAQSVEPVVTHRAPAIVLHGRAGRDSATAGLEAHAAAEVDRVVAQAVACGYTERYAPTGIRTEARHLILA